MKINENRLIRMMAVFILIIVSIPPALIAEKRWRLDIESGAVLPGYNDVQIPNNPTAARFSLKDDLSVGNEAYLRLRVSYLLSEKHTLSALYAPLSLNAKGIVAQPLGFQGVVFPAGSALNGLYRFNSYRLTYRYRLWEKPHFNLWIGFTAKIRDAEIALDSGTLTASKANVGFVPLLNLYMEWWWGSRLGMSLEADALAAKQGRAEDVALSLVYRFSPALDFRLGYRFVEGGADNESVYNFAMIHYLSGGLAFKF